MMAKQFFNFATYTTLLVKLSVCHFDEIYIQCCVNGVSPLVSVFLQLIQLCIKEYSDGHQ